MGLIDQQKVDRREHKENIDRLDAEEKALVASGNMLEKRVNDSVDVLKTKIGEYNEIEARIFKNLTEEEKAERKRLEAERAKAVAEEAERRR